MTHAEVISKIRKLLNMTTDKGCTESEALNAAGLAQKLMLKHNIQSLGLSDEPIEDIRKWDDPLDTMPASQRQAWRGRLAVVVTAANGCSVFWHGNRLMIVGRGSDAETCRYLYMFCLREIERMQGRYRGNGATWLNNWRLGVVSGIAQSLREAREAARTEYAQETGTSLIVVDQALATITQRTTDATIFMHSKLRVKTGRATSARYDDGARSTGRQDGKTINFRRAGKGIGSGAKQLKGN